MILFTHHPSRQRWVVLLYCAVALLFVGCASEPPADPQILPFCPSESSQIYTGEYYPELRSQEAKNVADEIYSLASSDNPVGKREALKFLKYEAERWSSVQYINYDPQPRMRVIVTFLTPGLVRAIVLNHFLYKGILGQPDLLEAETKKSLAILDRREEFAFIILIQPEIATTPVEFSLFPAEIIMHITDGSEVRSTHSDDILNSPLDTSENLYSGYFFYPVKVTRQGVCSYLLKPGIETSLLLKIAVAKFAEQENVTLNWVVDFPLLFNLDDPMLTIDRIGPVLNGEDGQELPIDQPPSAYFRENEDTINWRDVGRFYWWKVYKQSIPKE